MSSQEVVTLQDRKNPLLNRRELKVIIKNTQGQLNKLSAASLIASHFHLNQQEQVLPILMKNETGRTDIHALFYIYNSLEDARATTAKIFDVKEYVKRSEKKNH